MLEDKCSHLPEGLNRGDKRGKKKVILARTRSFMGEYLQTLLRHSWQEMTQTLSNIFLTGFTTASKCLVTESPMLHVTYGPFLIAESPYDLPMLALYTTCIVQ